MRTLCISLALVACSPPPPLVSTPVDDEIDASTTETTGDVTDPETEPTDEDGDGFSVEDGDCDDEDIWVNPGWDEDPYDDKDNDCDGRIDELFAGVVVVDRQDAESPVGSVLVHVDAVGDFDGATPLSTGFQPTDMDPDPSTGGWVAWSALTYQVARIGQDGAVELVVDFLEHEWPDDEVPVLGGFTVHPDGSYLVAGYDQLIHVQPDGSWEVVATWIFDFEASVADIAVGDLAVDRVTGITHLFGLVGGYAQWDAAGGFRLVRAGDLMEPTHSFWSATAGDSGGVWALGVTNATAEEGAYRWSEEDGSYEMSGRWSNGDFSPARIAVESETGDFYVSANGGWFYTVWRMYGDGTGASQLYTTDGTVQYHRYEAIAVVWDED